MKQLERPPVRKPGPGTWRDAIKGPFASYAAVLLRNGYSPVPILPKTKRPPDEGWNALRTIALTEEQVRKQAAERPAYGLGVAGGFGGLVPIDIDTDDDDIVDAVCAVIPTPTVAKKGQKGYTAFYRAPDDWTPAGRKFKPSPLAAPIVEILATGQAVIPPTLHPDTLRAYQWLTMGTLFNTRIEELPQLSHDFVERLTEVLRPWCPDRPISAPVAVSPAQVSNERLRIYALDVLHRRANELASMSGESGRNNALLAAASRVGSWVHHGVLSESEVRSALHGAYVSSGAMKDHGPKQFEATVRNGLKASSGDELRMPESEEMQPIASVDVASLKAELARKSSASNVIPLPSAVPAGDEFVFAADFKAEMPPALIRGLLPRNGLVVDGGQSGAGKTFAEVDMAVALASGDDWFGQPCRERVGVVYIAAEGQSSIQRRFIAACRHRGLEIGDLPIAIPNWSSVNLRDPKKRIEIMQKLRAVDAMMRERFGVRLGAIILDTVSASCPMKDENSNAEVGIVCRELREIADAADAVLIAVHHFGKSEDSGLRGGSAWRANCDHSRIFLATRDGPGAPARDRRMAVEKNRLGPEGDVVEFDLAIIPFGKDVYGDEINEAAVEVKGAAPRKIRLTKLEEAVTKVFYEALTEYRHDESMGLRPEERAVPVDAVRDKFEQAVASGQERLSRKEAEKKRSAWNRAFAKAQERLFKAETICGIEWLWPERGMPV